MSTQLPQSSEPRPGTSYRLVELGSDRRDVLISIGAPAQLAPGVTITIADSDGNAMIERSGTGTVDVAIDGAPLYEVAHCRPLQEIAIGDRSIVLLPPFGVFIRAKEDLADKRRRVEVLLGPAKPESVVALRKHLKAPPASQAKKRRRLLMMTAAGLMMIVTVGLASLPGEESEESHVEPSPAIKATVTLPMQQQSAAPKIDPPPQSAAKPVDVVAPEAKPRAKMDKREAGEPARKIPAGFEGTRLAPEREQAIRTQIESFLLEAGFDPEGAARKLESLKKGVPAKARILAEIDKAIRATKI